MKRIIFLLSFALSFILVGCEKMDNSPLVGVWALTDCQCYYDGNKVSVDTDLKTWTFYNDGTAYENDNVALRYKLKGSQLTITYLSSGNVAKYEILELTATSLETFWCSAEDPETGLQYWYVFKKVKNF